MSRIRTADPGLNQVQASWVPPHGSGPVGSPINYSWYGQYCVDDVGYTTDHPFDSRHISWTGAPTNWLGSYFQLEDQDLGLGYVPSTFNPYSSRGAVASSISTARIIAQSGPLTPRVYLPVDLFELRDLPGMLKHAGDVLHKLTTAPLKLASGREIASSTLAYLFGWQPLIEDIGRLLNFGISVDRRQRELKRLNAGRGIRRKLKMGKYPSGGTAVYPLYTGYGLNISPRYRWNLEHEAWATIHWKLKDPDQLGRIPSWLDTWRTVYGLQAGQIPVNVWKALPWTWMIDWFADISNLLNAYGNMVSYTPSRINLMVHTIGDFEWESYESSPVRIFGGASAHYEWKYREVRSLGSLATTLLRVPLLDTFRLSVLGSLAVLKL